MAKFVYFNDTERTVHIHPATVIHGCTVEGDIQHIEHGELATFYLPENTYAWAKMWDYGKMGLYLLVSPTEYEEKR